MQDRNGLIVDHALTQASCDGERTSDVEMIARLPGNRRVSVGADRGYGTVEFINDLRCLNVTSHVAQNTKTRRSAIDDRIRRHPGCTVSQCIRKRIGETFGWGKIVGPPRQLNVRGVARVSQL